MTQAGLLGANRPNWLPHQEAFAIYTGKVIAVHPAQHTVDLVLTDGGVVYGAAVMEMWAGTDYGDLWTPQYVPDEGVPPRGFPAEAWKVRPQRRRDAYAIVAYFDGAVNKPVVIGFFYPEISAMMVDQVQRLTRYVGDSFAAVAKDGSHWLAFDQDGGFVGFHTPEQGRPPDLTRQDYDNLLETKAAVHHFTARVQSGAQLVLDGESGNTTLFGSRGADIGAATNLDLSGTPLVLHGAEELLVTDRQLHLVGGLVRAPSASGDGSQAVNLCVNASYDHRLRMRERPQLNEGAWLGWRYLGDGAAARHELGRDGVLRQFWAAEGKAGAPVTWQDAPAVYAPHFLQFFFAGDGIQKALIPPDRFAVTGIAATCGHEVRVGGSAVAPTKAAPVVIYGPQTIEIEAMGVPQGGANVAIYGNHAV